MALIPIQRAPDAPIEHWDADDLVRTAGVVDTVHEHTTWEEYRFPTAAPDSPPIHRSVHVTLKQGLEAVGALHHFNVDAWAAGYIAELLAQRAATGQPVEVTHAFTLQEREALARVLAQTPGLGTLT